MYAGLTQKQRRRYREFQARKPTDWAALCACVVNGVLKTFRAQPVDDSTQDTVEYHEKVKVLPAYPDVGNREQFESSTTTLDGPAENEHISDEMFEVLITTQRLERRHDATPLVRSLLDSIRVLASLVIVECGCDSFTGDLPNVEELAAAVRAALVGLPNDRGTKQLRIYDLLNSLSECVQANIIGQEESVVRARTAITGIAGLDTQCRTRDLNDLLTTILLEPLKKKRSKSINALLKIYKLDSTDGISLARACCASRKKLGLSRKD